MAFTSFSRRRMLAAFAAAGGASRLGPFLPSSVFAASAPKRILTVFHPMGYYERTFWPKGTQTDFTLGETMSALEPVKNKLIFLDGLNLHGMVYYFNFPDNEHGLGGGMCFTGAKHDKKGATGPSIDQAVANFQYPQAKTQFRSLALGVNSGDGMGHSAIFYRSAGTPVVAQQNPVATFDQIFKDFTPPKAPGSNQPPDKSLARRQSILNMVKGDLSSLRSLAGKEDTMKLDAHLDGISSIENRLKLLQQPGSSSSGPIAAPGSVSDGCARPAKVSSENLEARVHAQMDLIAAAFACDLTRHASLQLGTSDGGIDAVPDVGQHDVAHACGDFPAAPKAIEDHQKYDRWWAARWAYLLNKLDSIKEGNGTVLDNTLVVFGQDTTTNVDKDGVFNYGPHCNMRVPIFLAGGGNFAFKTGQFIKLPRQSSFPGNVEASAQWVVHHRLLTSIGQAFGMNIDKFGDNDPGKGPLLQLTRA